VIREALRMVGPQEILGLCLLADDLELEAG
jgi:hypothetical protein